MRLWIDFDDDVDSHLVRYLDACARIRGISTRALTRRVLSAIAEDQPVENILDDQEDLRSRRKGEHPFREMLQSLERVR